MMNPYPLWSGDALPKSADIPMLDGVAFSVIQPYQPEVDGGNWVLGAALAWHRNRLYASYGFNCDAHENTATEQAHCRISDDGGRTWTVFIAGDRIFNIARWGGQAKALVSVSDDHGRSWTPAAPSTLNMNTSKPYTGTLSTGEHYLIGATTADCVHQRHILTIALTRPGETAFSRVFVIRHGVFPRGPGPSSPDAKLSYPYAIERGGKLYIGYADKREPTVELAVVPLSALGATASARAAAPARAHCSSMPRRCCR